MLTPSPLARANTVASGITNHPKNLASLEGALAVEYTLRLSDHHALQMFQFDHIIRKSTPFRLRFYTINLLQGAAVALFVGGIPWGLLSAIGTLARHYRGAATGDSWALFRFCFGFAAASIFAIWGIGMIPGSFIHIRNRQRNSRLFWRALRLQLQAGILHYPSRYRVVLTSQGFTETVSYRETDVAMEITEHKETRVGWVAVTRIDIAGEHAFFCVKDKGWLILPRAAFESEVSFLAFVDTARKYREAAHLAPAPLTQLPVTPEARITG
jgi:hypothetical protein